LSDMELLLYGFYISVVYALTKLPVYLAIDRQRETVNKKILQSNLRKFQYTRCILRSSM